MGAVSSLATSRVEGLRISEPSFGDDARPALGGAGSIAAFV
jgi:hypothetical protein